ncbi:MAG: hypothetical protein IPN61_10970 [Bacteroidetes bacterium]|nr:hypothetical protein [Bacteroidota bacterium]
MEFQSDLIRERIEKELKMISELGFAAYFLLNWTLFVMHSIRIMHTSDEGSGANSIVAYCLRYHRCRSC